MSGLHRRPASLAWASVLLALSSNPAAGQAANRELLTPCAIPGLAGEVLCGGLVVPEDRAEPDRRSIQIRFIVVPASSDPASSASAAEPLFVLEGGPGASTSRVAGMYVQTFAMLRPDRDLVLVDLRGTGRSAPLNCDISAPYQPGAPMYALDEIRACRERLVQMAAIHQYTTDEATADLDAVRDALGYESIHLFGISYGTRTGLVYMRDYPDRVATATLLAPYPLAENAPLDAATIAQASLDGLLSQCRADRACRSAYPDLEGSLKSLLAGWEEDPEPEPPALSRGRFTAALRLLLFSSQGGARTPYLLSRAAGGDFEPFAALAAQTGSLMNDWISGGTLLTVLCSEDVARLDPPDVRRRAEGTFFGAGWSLGLVEACEAWGSAHLPASFWDPVSSEAPTLLLVGELDPSMPPAWTISLAERLPNGRAIVIPEGHHSLIGMRGVGCVLRMIETLIETGSTEAIDESCLSGMGRVPFYVEP